MKIPPASPCSPVRACAAVIAQTALLLVAASPSATQAAEPIRWWVSTADLKQQLTEQPPLAWQATGRARGSRLQVSHAALRQPRRGCPLTGEIRGHLRLGGATALRP